MYAFDYWCLEGQCKLLIKNGSNGKLELYGEESKQQWGSRMKTSMTESETIC
jgi:hypothetical protein